MENLRIPEKYRRVGLYVYCNKCKRYSHIKTGCLKKSPDCNHPPDRQVYKLKVHVPGTKNVLRTLVINSRDIEEVEKKRLDFIDHLKSNEYNNTCSSSSDVPEANRFLLLYQMDRFTEYISKGGHYEFEAPRKLTISTIKDYKRNFRYFIKSIDGFANIKTIRVDMIKKEHIELFHKFIREKTPSDKTYNNIMGSLRAFYNHLINYEEFQIKNPFNVVPVLSIQYDTQSFSSDEFYKVLSVTTNENGYDEKHERNRYRDWLPMAFKLGIFSCLRLEELVNVKYKDIIYIETERVWILESDNRKANKLIVDKKNRRIKRIPVIQELHQILLEECDFENNMGKDEYIIAPKLERQTVKSLISKGFTHFKRKAEIDDEKCFKDLRTTYISRLRAEYGNLGLTATVSDHSNQEVVEKHYSAQIEAVKKSKDLRIFAEHEVCVN